MTTSSDRQAQVLLLLGILLFALGLLSGLTIPLMKNLKMGLGAHMAGVTNGTFLLVAGLTWLKADLSTRQRQLAYWSVIFGTWGNWFFITLAALWGTTCLAPISGAGYNGTPLQEAIVMIGLLSVAATIFIASGLMAWGFLRKLQY